MPAGTARRAQTSKQAKAAFKERGARYVSEEERKKLERGALLLRRAEYTRAQDARRKDAAKKRERDEEVERRQTAALGSQRKLDKFGHASSQFHLGKFFGAPKPQLPSPVPAIDPSDGVAGSRVDSDFQRSPSASPIDLHDFLESNTQISMDLDGQAEQQTNLAPLAAQTEQASKRLGALEPALVPVAPPKQQRPFTTAPSFGSDWSEDEITHLDQVIEEEMELRRSQSPVKDPIQAEQEHTHINLTLPSTSARQIPDTPLLMPPPPRPGPSRPVSMLSPALPRSGNMTMAPARVPPYKPPARALLQQRDTDDLARHGISKADLEMLAEQEVVFTQVP